MTRPVFGDPVAIATYTFPEDYVYEYYELAELPQCPSTLRNAYYLAGSDLAMIQSRSDPKLPELWKAQEAAEKALKAWARRQGLRVSKSGMREQEGDL